MTTQRLNGLYRAGYTLLPQYSFLKVSAISVINGIGIVATAASKVANRGLIHSAAGAEGNAGHVQGRHGATGVYLARGTRVVNFGSIVSGDGGAGYSSRSGGYAGGDAGAGVLLGAVGSVTNRLNVIGGDGGTGGRSSVAAVAGEGGDGGGGVILSAGGDVINTGSVRAGAGGVGGYGNSGAGAGGEGGDAVALEGAGTLTLYGGGITGGKGGVGGGGKQGGGSGGQGGSGASTSAYASLKNNALVAGGQGGAGGVGVAQGQGGDGGGGGEGVDLQGGGSILNSATLAGGGAIVIAGGQGGLGGVGGYGAGGNYALYGGAGGAGGAGVSLIGGVLTNRAVIDGGAGGGGGQGGALTGGAAAGGDGGAGIDVSALGASLYNTGTIQGGAGGAGGAAYGAVFLGSGSYLTAGAGGAGGAGIVLGAGSSLVISGLVYGGSGGAGGAGSGYAADGAAGVGGDGVDLLAGAGIINRGAIRAGAGGMSAADGLGGFAHMPPSGLAGAGVVLAAGCSLNNASGATIYGSAGVRLVGAYATVTNYGTISGAIYSVDITSARDVLIAQTGAQFFGAIAGGGATFELPRGTGTITGLGGEGVLSGADSATFAGFGSYLVGGTGFTLAGANALARGQNLTDTGVLTVSGSLDQAVGATVTVGVGATLTFRGGGDDLAGVIAGGGLVSFTGVTDVFDGVDLTVANAVINSATVTLQGAIGESGSLSVITSTLLIGAGGVTLSGGGSVTLSDNASNLVEGLDGTDTLVNVDQTISGAGYLGGGRMDLGNRAAATINGNGARSLIIDVGANQIVNAGLIEASGPGGVMIQSAISSTGTLEANGGTLTVNGAVTGQGQALIAGGALVFNSSFNQDVAFTGLGGLLLLTDSIQFSAQITGFSGSGLTTLDLSDITFTGADEASFSGDAHSGVLVVSDGTRTAQFTLMGDYRSTNFVTSSDNEGGVDIVGAAMNPARSSTQVFVAASAAFGASGPGEWINTVMPETGRVPQILAAVSRPNLV